jgi:two-component system, response regulator FlrC
MRGNEVKQAPLSGRDAGDMVGRTLAEVERNLILDTLRHCSGNRTRAAHTLGISIRTLRNKLNEYAADGASIPPARCGMKFEGAA